MTGMTMNFGSQGYFPGRKGIISGPVSFFQTVLLLNHLPNDYPGWLILPGMFFGDRPIWWKKGERPGPHEGLDLCWLADRTGQRLALPGGALLPPLWPGEVAGLFADFLGRTVVVRHPMRDEREWELVSLYAHVRPLVDPGTQVFPDKPLAALPAEKAKPAPPAHLHLSLAWLSPDLPAAELSWPVIRQSRDIRLVDPLPWVQPRSAPAPGCNCGAA